MGDCRLRISVAGDLLQTNDISVNRVFSADTTVREVFEEVLLPLCWKHPPASIEDAALFPDGACLWDCTLHPPRDITDWPLKLFPNKTGPQSKTLYDAGWFPSGTLQVLPSGTTPSVAAPDIYDAQYNQPTQIISTKPSSRVRLTNEGPDNVMPSQVLQSVTTRFHGDDQEQSDKALQLRKQNRVARQLKELDRNRRLEERIRELEKSTNKNKKTSLLVRNMLIKSRCTGSKYLDESDRVYLHCVVVSGDNIAAEYRYFSRQDTVAKLVSSLETSSSSFSTDAELLVRTGASEYRRLPTTMRLYEALSQQYLKQVDSIVIRWYSAGSDRPTTSVLEDTVAMEEEFERNNTCETDNTDAQENTITTICVTEDTKGEGMLYERLRESLEAMDEAQAKKTKGKKKSKTSDTVRAMLIKGRAKGDIKRVPRMDDRFFMELVLVQEAGDKMVPKQSYVFLAKTDPVGRLLRDCVPGSKGMESIVLIHPSEDGSFGKVSLDLTWQEAQDKGIIKPFDRVVVWLYKR